MRLSKFETSDELRAAISHPPRWAREGYPATQQLQSSGYAPRMDKAWKRVRSARGSPSPPSPGASLLSLKPDDTRGEGQSLKMQEWRPQPSVTCTQFSPALVRTF